jgi:predicted ATPase/DNA-binding SARP family transcriptional activator
VTGQPAPVDAHEPSRCEFAILGPLEIRRDGRPLVLPAPRPRALLVILLVHANRAVSVDELCDELWDQQPPTSARAALQVHVAALRRALGAAAARLVTRPPGYVLELDDDQLDARRFERALGEAQRTRAAGGAGVAERLRAALALWRGPALTEFADLRCARDEAVRLEELRLGALEGRVEADLAAGRDAELVAELRQLTDAHPWRERFHAQLMLALYRAGRQADALQAYRCAREMLVEQLGIEPRRELGDLQRAILAQDPALSAPGPARGRPRAVASTLPVQTGELFGRDTDIDRLTRRLNDPRTRLVTLVGPGGVGKTALAMETAGRLSGEVADGACLVELASLAEAGELAAAIARALGAPMRQGEPPKGALLRFLADCHLLLVLDNFEHLLDGAPLIGELLSTCPDVTALITSREPTRLGIERLYPVRPLDVPGPGDADSAAAAARYSAVAMFNDRARARDPEFALDEISAPHVAAICRRLDGLPLALELAAARIGLLSPAEIERRLDHVLSLLVGGARDAPERQRTLRAAIDWSYGLLAGEERRAFARMAVFAAGATVVAAETVTGASLDTLDSLVAKQLLTRRDERLLMLETVREYALECLDIEPDAHAVYQRLGDWCLAFTRAATPNLVRAERSRWQAVLDAELPNILGAVAWALRTGRAELALQLVGELGEYWWHGQQWQAGLPWIEAALEGAQGASDAARARALLYRARLTGMRRQEARYQSDLQVSLDLFRACEDAAGVAACLGHFAAAAAWTGDFARATALADEAIELAARSHDHAVRAFVFRASAASGRDYDEVVARAEPALEYLRATGDLLYTAWICNLTGYQAIVEGRHQEALRWLNEGLDVARRVEGNPHWLFMLQANVGLARLFLEQLEQAREAFSEAVALCREAGSQNIVDEALLGMAAVAALRGEYSRAAGLAGAARAHSSGGSLSERAVWQRLSDILAAAREQFGAERWDRAERLGGALSVHEAIDLAIERGQFAHWPLAEPVEAPTAHAITSDAGAGSTDREECP